MYYIQKNMCISDAKLGAEDKGANNNYYKETILFNSNNYNSKHNNQPRKRAREREREKERERETERKERERQSI